MQKFPENFTWGTATSSFQIEGAWNVNGKGPSIWDAFCQIPGKVVNQDHGQIACNHYHLFREDIQLMKQMGVTAYRFSIAWPRIQPTGKGKANKAGIRFYNDLIDTLLENDITPWVTLYHWDLPLALQFEDDGWLNPKIADYFAKYADICFSHFGDRVTNWITINEPWVIAMHGYGNGVFAPGRVSNTEPYQAAHQILRAHAKAVALYRSKYQIQQNGRIGNTNNCDWREPLTDLPADKKASQRSLEFFLAWFTDPIYRGSYPESMIQGVGERLPKFDQEDLEILVGSSDFFGLNHYTTMFASDAQDELIKGSVYGNGGLSEDQRVNLSVDPTWKQTSMNWSVVPWGCKKLLQWIDDRYESPEIVITENGCAFDDQVVDGEVNDQDRIDYYRGYLEACYSAIENGVKLSGYFAWSFMDNFEWASGYEKRFGMHHVDFKTLKRTPKASSKWYRKVIENGLETSI